MTGSTVALDGSTLDFVTPAIGQADKFREFKECWRSASDTVADNYGMFTSCFSAWYMTVKRFREKLAFIKRRGEDRFCGYITCGTRDKTLVVHVSILPDYRGNGYARAATLFACSWSSEQERPCNVLALCADLSSVEGCNFIKGFGHLHENADIGILTARIPIRELVDCKQFMVTSPESGQELFVTR